MAEMLLLNPRRRKARKATAKRRAGRRVRRANPLAMVRRPRRRRNPLPMFSRARRHMTRRRRRNPIGLGGALSGSSIMTAMKDALVGAGGAVAVDMLYGKIAPMLPASLQRVPGKVGAGDLVKFLFTIMAGRVLRGPTRGLSMKAAAGALTVQAHGIVKSMLPATMLSEYDGIGYWSPAGASADESMRVGPAIDGMDSFVTGTALLNEYTDGSGGVLLNGMPDAFSREGITNYR